MFTLFIDTHAELIYVALCSGDKLLVKTQESLFSHAKFLAPMIDSILKENSLTVKDIKNVVAVNGPGSFTGLRIGLSAAKTLACFLNIPIYLISSLSAYLVSDDSKCDKYAVIEDSRGFYLSAFDMDNNPLMQEVFLEDIQDYKNKYVVLQNLNVRKVIDFALSSKPVNSHLVRANYVKKIEVEK